MLEVTCDKCENVIQEEDACNVELVISDIPDKIFEIDMCSPCLESFSRGSRLKEGQKKKYKKRKTAAPAAEFVASAFIDGNVCSVCSKSYATPRGLRAHQSMKEHK